MTNGTPSRGELATLRKAQQIAEQCAKWQREHPQHLNAGLHYVASDAARALDTLLSMFH